MKTKTKKYYFVGIMIFIFLFALTACFGESTEISVNYTKIAIGEENPIKIVSNEAIKVSSSDEDVVIIDEDYNIIGLEQGTATVTVTYGEETFDIDITVVDASLSVEKEISLKDNDEIDLSTLVSSNYSEDFIYIVTDEKVATVENNKLKGVKEGDTTLTVSIKQNNIELSETMKVKVYDSTVQANLTLKTEIDSLTVGATLQLEVESPLQNDEIEYSVNNDELATISSDGLLTVLKEGELMITIKSKVTGFKLEKVCNIVYNWPTETLDVEGVYQGLVNYGTVTNSQMDSFVYKFFVEGETKNYTMAKVGKYELQNILEEGNIYRLKLDGTKITGLVKLNKLDTFSPNSESLILEGKIQEISNYFVKVNDQVYKLFEDSKQLEITKAAGGSKVKEVTLKAGDEVKLSLTNEGNCKNVYKTKLSTAYTPILTAVPGERTLTNFFRTALTAVGHALYVYGGNWNYQDDGSSNQARSIGVADTWVNFFYEQDASYNYKNTTKSVSYYPFGAFNEYYYAGVDCSGYVGWVIYNIMNTENGKDGYVMGSSKQAQYFANQGWGTWTKNFSEPTSGNSDFKVGDIMSTDGHVWICLGTCDDGSMVIIHSTPSDSIRGNGGGGAQIGAIGKNQNCEAYQLAKKYNEKYYVDWSARYNTSLKTYSAYTTISKATSGKFTWYINQNGVTDPDGLFNKKPAEIFKILFNEE